MRRNPVRGATAEGPGGSTATPGATQAAASPSPRAGTRQKARPERESSTGASATKEIGGCFAPGGPTVGLRGKEVCVQWCAAAEVFNGN